MKYEYWFANIKGLTNKEKIRIRGLVPLAKALFYIEETELKKLGVEEKFKKSILNSIKEWKLEDEYKKLCEKKVKLITVYDSRYPEKLKNISSAPYALYAKGELPKSNVLSVAMVGARSCSAYGQAMAKEFSQYLAQAGVQIISGMALGIDGISQRSALACGGKSFGVLGCGADICYPPEHYSLYQQLESFGGIISEQPIGTKPFPSFFPARNRIISGLSDVVVVIEAKEKSGSLITADMALEQGRDVYALPGPITSILSKGCHNLIKQGAGILISPQEFLNELGVFHQHKIGKEVENKIVLETTENMVYSCLDFEPQNLDELLIKTTLELPVLIQSLICLEVKGYIKEIGKNYYVKVK